MTRRPSWLVIACVLLAASAARSQQNADAFDVASVKINKGASGFGASVHPGRVTFTAMPLREIIATAYGFGFSPESPMFQSESKLVGGDPKLLATGFDIIATYPDATTARVPAMLRNLLATRFGLRAHFETRRGNVYELRVARADGSVGPQFKASKHDCLAYQRGGGRVDAADAPRDANGRSWCWPPLNPERMRLGERER